MAREVWTKEHKEKQRILAEFMVTHELWVMYLVGQEDEDLGQLQDDELLELRTILMEKANDS